MTFKRFFIILLLFLSFLRVPAQTTLDTAVNFTCKDITGNVHHLFNYLDSNKFVVIDFFTATCGACQLYAPRVNQSYLDFGCNQGNVIFLAMNTLADNQSLHEFDSIYGITFPSVSGRQGGGDSIDRMYEIVSHPTVILIAPNKQIVEKYIWPPDTEILDSIITSYGGFYQPCSVGLPAIIKKQNHAVTLLPNPARDYANISIEASPGKYYLSLYDITGVLLAKQPVLISNQNKEKIQLPLGGFSPGCYLLSLANDTQILEKTKLIILR